MSTVSRGRWFAFAVCLSTIVAFGAPDGIQRGPRISFAAGVPSDLRGVATETWARFLAAFPKQRDCLAPVTVASAWSYHDRAGYRPDERLVTVRIPATKPNLEASLIHEFAHHLEFTCKGHRHVRARFLVAQGFAIDAPWWTGETWENTPSEHFAEAAVVEVLGTRPSHVRIGITSESLTVLRRWAGTE